MSLIVACPNCQTRYNLPAKFEGKKVKCKSCGKPFAASVGAARATAGAGTVAAKPSAQRGPQVDPQALAKMGIGALPQQPDPFATPAASGPDPLRNHVVQDPGFGTPTEIPSASNQPVDEEDGLDPDFQAVVSNPYIQTLPSKKAAASANPSKSGGKGKRLKDATWSQRFGGYFIDNLFLNGVLFAGFYLAGLVAESIPTLVIIVSTVLFLLSYFFIFEGITGRTVGKYLSGTKVVNLEGGKASFLQVVGRTFSRLIPLEPFSMLLYDNKSRPTFWHDSLPGTRVIEL